MFEYINPFYDGNGRMGRYLLSLYLSRHLDVFSSLSISEAVKDNKKKYEDAFISVSNPKNCGEITFFVDEMLKLLIEGQENAIAYLEDVMNKLLQAQTFIAEQTNFSGREQQFLFILLQNYLFTFLDTIMNQQLAKELEATKYSRHTIDQLMKKIADAGYLERVKQRPTTYRWLTDKLPIFD